MDNYIAKPVRLEDVRAIVERWAKAAASGLKWPQPRPQAPRFSAAASRPRPASRAAKPAEDAPVDMSRLLDFTDGDPANLRELVTLYFRPNRRSNWNNSGPPFRPIRPRKCGGWPTVAPAPAPPAVCGGWCLCCVNSNARALRGISPTPPSSPVKPARNLNGFAVSWRHTWPSTPPSPPRTSHEESANRRGQPARCEYYGNRFTLEGFQVKIAPDGQAGLDLVHSFRPDVVILDLMLPKMTGVELMKKIRAEPGLAPLPVIVFSDAYMTAMMEQAWKAGATKCPSKEHSTPKQVVEAVRRALAPKDATVPAPLAPVGAPAPAPVPSAAVPPTPAPERAAANDLDAESL